MLFTMAAMLAAAPLWPGGLSKSANPCATCHRDGRYMYLDILEGDAGNKLPTAINDGQTLAVAVVVQVTGNTNSNNVMSGIYVTLASQNGFFSVASPSYSLGSLAAGQSATAYWNISVVSAGNDVMLVTARGLNSHKNQQFSDSYDPRPAITVNKAAADQPPSVEVTDPADGQTAKGTLTVTGTAAKGTRAVTAVQYRIDSGAWTDASGTQSWSFTVDTTKLGNGAHTIEVRSYDGSLYSTIASRSITVNNQKSADGGSSTPMLDGWVILALVAAVGGLICLKRK
jgi:hypothetical protein